MRYLWVILSSVILTVGLGKIYEFERSLHLQIIPPRLEHHREQLVEISRHLRHHKASTGAYPSNDQGLLSVKSLSEACDEQDRDWSSPLRWARVSESGLLSIWGEPLIYENRTGWAAGSFADSGATTDTGRMYSLEVDEGIYVWSIGARKDFDTYKKWHNRHDHTRALIVAASIACLAVFLCLVLRSSWKNWAGIWPLARSLLSGAIVWLVVFAGIFPSFIATCYEMRIAWNRRPELTKEYLALIDRYHERGIIGDEAYGKIINSIKN